jgi:hypothetical protein
MEALAVTQGVFHPLFAVAREVSEEDGVHATIRGERTGTPCVAVVRRGDSLTGGAGSDHHKRQRDEGVKR